MRIGTKAINRVQKRQIAEGLDVMADRMSIDKDDVSERVYEVFGRDAPIYLSGLYTGIDLGIELQKTRVADHVEDPHHDEFLESLPEAGFLEST